MKWKKSKGRQKRWAKRRLINQHGAICQAKNGHAIKEMHDITLDHIVPVSLGGTDLIENLQLACLRHNQEKRNMTPEDWQEFQEL